MPAEAWAAVIAGAGLIVSVIVTAVVTGYRVGRIEAQLQAKVDAQGLELRGAQALAQSAVEGQLRAIGEKLARIEGLFEYRLRGGPGAAA